MDIRSEMRDAGFIRKQGEEGASEEAFQAQWSSGPPAASGAGGRNNRQNDKLTLKDADYRDLWFHVQKLHGSTRSL